MAETTVDKPVNKIGWRPRDLARSLDVAPHIIYEAIAAGEFGVVWRLGRSGKAIVIPEESVQRWLQSKQHGTGDVAA
jgi:hypothetical protein